MSDITLFVTLTKMICPSCGGAWAIAQEYLNEAYKLGHFKKCWSCPYCKEERGYGEGRIDKLEKQLASKEQSLLWERDRAERAYKEAEHFRKSRDGIKGALTKVKKRIGRGTCPCCKRHFVNVERHMESKHPHYHSGNDK